jgi:lysophospholipid acyltransferase (LPLAT)-like uncharacterized protein
MFLQINFMVYYHAVNSGRRPLKGCMRFIIRFLQTNVITKTFMYWYLRLLFETYRLQVVDETGGEIPFNSRPGLYYLWHEHAIAGLYFLHSQGVFGHLISDETIEGKLAGFAARKLGLHVMYSTGKISFAKKILEVLDMNKRLFVVGDGTYGPAHELQREIPYMCARSGVPLVYIECRASTALALAKRWDKLKVPLPFSTITITLHPPCHYAFNEQHQVVEQGSEK